MDPQGTELYDQNRGSFVDLSILDVLQIFGRAGRPQFDTSGTGIIITTHDKLSHYLKSMMNQFPIESNFINLLADHLNAEVWDIDHKRSLINNMLSYRLRLYFISTLLHWDYTKANFVFEFVASRSLYKCQ